jgi:hypothetical protein
VSLQEVVRLVLCLGQLHHRGELALSAFGACLRILALDHPVQRVSQIGDLVSSSRDEASPCGAGGNL